MKYGRFSGSPKTEWLTEPGSDRGMRLLEDFHYEDPSNRRWSAPKGSIVNGASIPRALWSSVGSPYTDDYRRASIVHDVACGDSSVNRNEADKMFYYACLAGGCSIVQARLLYAGVKIGSWASDVLPTSASDIVGVQYKLPGNYSIREKTLRAKFSITALSLDNLPSDATLEDVDLLVSKSLLPYHEHAQQ